LDFCMTPSDDVLDGGDGTPRGKPKEPGKDAAELIIQLRG
jgi:hypothetical protein